MTASPDSETRLGAAQSYLVDYLADEEFHGAESQDWFGRLSEYVAQLTLDDQLIVSAAVYLQPFLDDDERIDCAMYPGGEAVRFLEQGWGGDLREYVAGFLDAMGRDHWKWQRAVAEAGYNARWTLE